MWTTQPWVNAVRSGQHHLHPNVVGQNCMLTMFFRRMRERIWTFWLDAVALPSHETPTKLRRRQLGPPPRKEESIRESRAKRQRRQGSPVLAAMVHFSDQPAPS